MELPHDFPQTSMVHSDFHGLSTFTGDTKPRPTARFGGDYRDPSPRDADGTPLVAITAMDALDFRGEDRRWDHVFRAPVSLQLGMGPIDIH